VIKDRLKVNAMRTDSQKRLSVPDASLPDSGESTERIEALQRALSELPELERTVLLLAKFQRLSYREIAQATGLDPKAVEYRLRKAAKKGAIIETPPPPWFFETSRERMSRRRFQRSMPRPTWTAIQTATTENKTLQDFSLGAPFESNRMDRR
jgi:DNA-binding CsgD family transcriptional regulator